MKSGFNEKILREKVQIHRLSYLNCFYKSIRSIAALDDREQLQMS